MGVMTRFAPSARLAAAPFSAIVFLATLFLATVFLPIQPAAAQATLQSGPTTDAPSEGVRILVFVDDVFSIEPRRDAVLRSLSKQLGELGPEDAMTVVAWDGESTETLASWTGDPAELEAALGAARERDAQGLLRRSEWARLESLDDGGRRSFGGSSFSSIGFHGSHRHLRPGDGPTAAVARHLSRLAEAVSAAIETASPKTASPKTGSPKTGRRAMLLLSGGLPRTIGPDALDPVADAARRAGWAVYPVDLGAALVTHSPEPDPSGALASLAERTGAVPYLDGRRFTALGRALAHLRSPAAHSRSSTSP